MAKPHDIKLETQERAALCSRLMQQLLQGVPGSKALLRGSLASKRADLYSDIDILWEVPDAAFPTCLTEIDRLLERVERVDSLRYDPDFFNSDKRRLIYVRFKGVPLFWRVDLSVMAASLKGNEHYDEHNPAARGGWEQWSWQESALLNAVSAIKEVLRGHFEPADGLLERAFDRLELTRPEGPIKAQILGLVAEVEKMEPGLKSLAKEVRQAANLLTD